MSALSCERCGVDLVGRDPQPDWYHDEEEIRCGCGAVNRIAVDEIDAHVAAWTCAHSMSDEEECEACEREDAAP